jgi:hypothetical protein
MQCPQTDKTYPYLRKADAESRHRSVGQQARDLLGVPTVSTGDRGTKKVQVHAVPAQLWEEVDAQDIRKAPRINRAAATKFVIVLALA